MNEPSEEYVMLRNLNAKLRAELAEKQQDIERYLRDKEGEIADLRAQLAEKEAAKNKLNELLCAEKQQIREERDAIIAKLFRAKLDAAKLPSSLQASADTFNSLLHERNKLREENERLKNTVDDLLDGRQNPNYPKALSSREGPPRRHGDQGRGAGAQPTTKGKDNVQ